jgi:hypothetical protein
MENLENEAKVARQVRENNTVRLLNKQVRIDVNKFKTNVHNSPTHEGLKKRVFNWLVKNGLSVVCEATFLKGGRADLLVLDPPLAIEVMVSETQERFEAKDYPVEKLAVKKLKDVKEAFKDDIGNG